MQMRRERQRYEPTNENAKIVCPTKCHATLTIGSISAFILAMHALYTYVGLDWIFGGMDAMQGVCLEARAEDGGAQEERECRDRWTSRETDFHELPNTTYSLDERSCTVSCFL